MKGIVDFFFDGNFDADSKLTVLHGEAKMLTSSGKFVMQEKAFLFKTQRSYYIRFKNVDFETLEEEMVTLELGLDLNINADEMGHIYGCLNLDNARDNQKYCKAKTLSTFVPGVNVRLGPSNHKPIPFNILEDWA